MPPRDRPALLGRVRELTERFKSGSPRAFEAFRELTDFLLRLTILAPHGGITQTEGPRPEARALGGWRGPDDPLPLRDGRYLRFSVTLFREAVQGGYRLKVADSAYQYQADVEGDRWIFRYDFLRQPPEPHPASHLQVRGALSEACLPEGTPLERVHFPTARVSVEAVVRLLVDQFHVPTAEPPEVWRPVLAESEALFLEIAHRSLSGPAA